MSRVLVALCVFLVHAHLNAMDVGGGDDDDDDTSCAGWNLSFSLPSAWARAFHGWDAFPPSPTLQLLRRIPAMHPWEVLGSEEEEPTLRRTGEALRAPLHELPLSVGEAVRSSMIYREDQMPASYPFLGLTGGYLISIDKGQYGGMIAWYDNETETLVEVSKTPCRAFRRWNDRTIAIGGWRGLTSFTGELQVLNDAVGKRPPALERMVVLPQPGLASCLTPKGDLLVVCETLILEVRGDFSLNVLYGRAGMSLHLSCQRQTCTWSYWGERLTARYVQNDIMIGTEGGFVHLHRVDCPGRPRFQESWLLPLGLIPRVPPTKLYFGDL